ncbi:hypothetical protein [Streptococcus tangpeifui]|uniref:hypothetical protein n=1 Tax=Streptococcus tangpeifui TaxID=2709400 RepID=UPI0013EE28D9|nr:hypothetical protein [Streptococcus sp. ZJ373]
MNTMSLDSMAFDNFEVVDGNFLSNVDGGAEWGNALLSAATSIGFGAMALTAAPVSVPATLMLLTAQGVSTGLEIYYLNKD